MKFSCEKLLLQNAVNTTSRAVAAKSSIPALEGLLLQCGDGVLTVSGYNMQTGIRTRFPVEAAEDRICAGVHVPCPPAIPIAVSGERISGACINIFRRYGIPTVDVVK